jgi:hypothetical protein
MIPYRSDGFGSPEPGPKVRAIPGTAWAAQELHAQYQDCERTHYSDAGINELPLYEAAAYH